MTRYAVYENAMAVGVPTSGHGTSLLSGYLGNGWKTVRRWGHRAQQRRQLLALDERMLRDIGLTLEARTREGMKPFWEN